VSSGLDAGAAVLGGGVMKAGDYARFLAEDYLAEYLPAGGGSVKVVVVGDADVANRFEGELRAAAATVSCHVASVSAESTRVHMIDQLFFSLARQIDWDQVAAAVVAAAYDAIAFPVTDDRLAVAEVARAYDIDARELYRSVRRQLERSLLHDNTLPRELRRALLRLAQAHLGEGDASPEEAQVVRDWLVGEPVALRDLREVLIHGRIGRHNARDLLTSVGGLLQRAGHRGLVIYLDLTRLAESRRPAVPERTGIYYTKMAVLDTYELLRQLIDGTDDLVGVIVVAVVPPELVTDENRGLPSYAPLQLRVADEVRDRRRANPYASLVRLEVRLEAVR
jgi:transposase-like protein